MLGFEDLDVGQAWSPGRVSVTADEIRAFAERYDPQPFHLDPAAAERHFDGLIASGWHTAALCMRPFADHVLDEVAVVAAIGVDDLRWHEPVRPGGVLTVDVTVVRKREWNEDRGLVGFRLSATNGDGAVVHERSDLVLVERRRSDDGE